MSNNDFNYRVLTTNKSDIATDYRRKNPEYGSRRVSIPGWLLDKMADDKMNQGYSKKKNPVCNKCFTQKSISGNCNC